MTTYILGAGASRHAGYPLTTQLWARLVTFAQTTGAAANVTGAISTVAAVHGPVTDVEALLTSLHRGDAPFQHLHADDRRSVMAGVLNGVVGLFHEIRRTHPHTTDYDRFARVVKRGDTIITFNYDTAVDAALAKLEMFHAPDGYGFSEEVGELNSQVRLLKPHGSINWIAWIFRDRERMAGGWGLQSLGKQPVVDNADGSLANHAQTILSAEFTVGAMTGSVSLVLPMHSKRFSVTTDLGEEWVDFYDRLWTGLADALSHSDEIVIIGYRMPPADNRACGAILHHANKHALIRVNCGDASEEIADRFFQHGFLRVRAGGYFQDFLDMKSMAPFADE